MVHLDALALGRAGLWVLGRVLVGFKVMRTGGWAVALELPGRRGLLLAGVQRALGIAVMNWILVPGIDNVA